MSHKIHSGILTGALSACILTAACGPVTAQTLQEDVSVIPSRTISPAEESEISTSAAHVLRQIVKARWSIHEDDLEQAQDDLDQAEALIDDIKITLPTAKVKDQIWSAKKQLDYESAEEVIPDLIPINASLTEIEGFVPVKEVRKHIQRARGSLNKGDKKTAKEELKAANAALVYTEMDLPLNSTERQVLAAQKALNEGLPEQADQKLKAAEKGVQFLSVATTAPLQQAQKSIWQASRDYAAKDYAAAKTDLARADNWLNKAEKGNDENIHEDATDLKRRTDNLQDEIDQKGAHTGSALIGLWHRSKALTKYEVERLSSFWKGAESQRHSKAELIDAKLHIDYAESAQFYHGKSSEVRSELDKANDNLKQAGKSANKELRTKIHALREELKQMKANVNNYSANAQASYEQIEARLRQLIHDL